MGVVEWFEDKVDNLPIIGDALDVIDKAPNIGIWQGAKLIRPTLTAPVRAPVATYNLFRGIAGTVGVGAKNIFWDGVLHIGIGYGDRTAVWENPLSSIWEFVEQDVIRDIVGLPASDGSLGSSYGMFRERGVTAGVFGIVPEEARAQLRPAILQTAEGLEYAFNNAVDNPLSMGLIMLDRAGFKIQGGLVTFDPKADVSDIGRLFDIDEWSEAYEIAYVEDRTMGQSLAVMSTNIDPFDRKAYNALETQAWFNLASGTVDLAKEIFLDPIDLIGAGTLLRLSRGATVIAKVDEGQELLKIYDFGIPISPRRQAMPSRIWLLDPTETKGFRLITEKDNWYSRDPANRALEDIPAPGQRLATFEEIQQEQLFQQGGGLVDEVPLTPRTKTREHNIGIRDTITSARAKGFTEGAWFNESFDFVWRAVPQDLFSESFKRNGVITDKDWALIQQRYTRWRQVVSRKVDKDLDPEVAWALATSASREAAQNVFRQFMGDLTVKADILEDVYKATDIKEEAIKKVESIDIRDSRIAARVKRLESRIKKLDKWRKELDHQLNRYKDVGTKIYKVNKSDLKEITDEFGNVVLETVEQAQNRLRRNERASIRRKQREIEDKINKAQKQNKIDDSYIKRETKKVDADRNALDLEEASVLTKVNFYYHFEMDRVVRRAQQKNTTLGPNGSVNIKDNIVDEWAEQDLLTARMLVDDIISGALIADGVVARAGSRSIRQPIGIVHRMHLDRLNRDLSRSHIIEDFGWDSRTNWRGQLNRASKKAGKKIGFKSPETFRPLGFDALKVVRMITERVPQGLIHFSDLGGQSDIMIERMIRDASEFIVGGKKIITEAEAAELIGGYQRRVAQGADYSALAQYFDEVKSNLINRAEDLMIDADIKYFDGENWVSVEKGFLQKQLDAGYSDYLNRLEKGEFKSVDTPPSSALTVDSTGMRGKRVYKDGELITDPELAATYHISNRQDGIIVQTWNMSLAQMTECAVVPRFDLLQREVNKAYNLRGRGKIGDARRSDTVKHTRLFARGLQEVWTSGKLLTPRWTARVLFDEKLRVAAVIGLMPMLATINKGFNNYVQKMSARAVNFDENTFRVAVVNEWNKRDIGRLPEDATLFDVAEAFEKSEDLLGYETFDDLLEEATDNHLKKILEDKKESKGLSWKQKKSVGLALRGLTGSLINPVIGATWAWRGWRSRTKALNEHAEKMAARNMAQSYKSEALRIIEDATDDPEVLALANMLGSRGDDILEDLLWLEDEFNFGLSWADKDKVVSIFDKANMYWEKAGYGKVQIGNRSFNNGWGTDIRHHVMAEQQLSSSRTLDRSMRGRVASDERNLRESLGDWEPVDYFDDPKGFAEAWVRTFQQLSPTGTQEKAWFNIMYDPKLSRADKIEKLASLIERTPRIQRKLDVPREFTEGSGASDTFKAIAEDAIAEVDDFFPPEFFPDLRSRVRAGEELSWQDMESILKDEQFLTKHKLVGKNVNDVIRHIRNANNNSSRNFGIARKPKDNPSTGVGKLRDKIRGYVDKAFNNLGTAAADDISRGPFFEARYRAHLIQNTKPYLQADGSYKLTPKEINRMEESARRAAFRDTREVLYELAEHSQFAEMVGFMSPFFNAWQEVIGRWAGLALENPSFALKGLRWFSKDNTSIPILGIQEEKDFYGNEVVVLDVGSSPLAELFVNPKFLDALDIGPVGSVGNLASEVPIAFTKNSMFSMLTQTTPRAGPFITWPIRQMALEGLPFGIGKGARPEIGELLSWMFPYGHPDGNFLERAAQEFLPTWANHLWYRAVNPEDRIGNSWSYDVTVLEMIKTLDVTQRLTGNPYNYEDEEVMQAVIDKAHEMAKSVGFLKFLGSSIVPVATNYTGPYREYVDSYRFFEETGRKLGKDPDWAITMFLDRHGDEFFYLTGNNTKNVKGVDPTLESYALSQKHEDFIDKYPVLTGAVTNSIGGAVEEAEWSDTVWQIQKNEGWREVLDPKIFIDQIESRQGWRELQEWKDTPLPELNNQTYNDVLYREGTSSSINAEINGDLKVLLDEKKFELSEKYPLFGEDLDDYESSDFTERVIEAAVALVSDPKLVSQYSWAPDLIEYLAEREIYEDILRRLPDPTLTNEDNLAVLLEWGEVQKEFATRPKFAGFHNRYLANDLIPPASWRD